MTEAERNLWIHLATGTAISAFIGILFWNPRTFAIALFGWMLGGALAQYVTHGKI